MSAWRQFLRRTLTALLPSKLFLVRGAARTRSVCLTFDDGPHPEHTPRLLDALRAAGVSATFFVIGKNAAQYPDLVRRMADEGHVVANHSYTHTRRDLLGGREVIEEVRRTRDLLRSLLGSASRFFRPPNGKVRAADLLRLWLDGQTVVLWSVDPKDFACRSAGEVRDWFEAHPLRGGDVVLLHDNVPHAAAALPDLVRSVREQGLDFAPLMALTG
jgi:peptidoglycan/xylan/chitin deacetylase (PgdA/CDA1 family)